MNTPERRHLKVPLHVLAAAGSTLLLLLVAFVLAWNAYGNTRELIHLAGKQAIQNAVVTLQGKIQGVLRPAQDQLGLLAFHSIARAQTKGERLEALALARSVLEANPLVDAWYVAYPDGDFVLFRLLRDEAVRLRTKAPPEASLLVQTMTGGSGEYSFYDANGQVLVHEKRPDYRYDPRTRPWYDAALNTEGIAMTQPYLFFTRQEVGITLSQKSRENEAVIGLDATLDELSQALSSLKLTPHSQVAIVDEAQHIIAVEPLDRALKTDAKGAARIADIHQPGLEPLAEAGKLIGKGLPDEEQRIGNGQWKLIAQPLMKIAEGRELRLLMAVSLDELFGEADALLKRQLLIAVGLIVFSIPFGLLLTQQLVRPLNALAEEAQAIASFEAGATHLRRSHIAEVEQLSSAISQMRGTISRFRDLSSALNSETRLERLLEIVLNDVALTAHAKSGALYLFDPGSQALRRALMRANEKEAAHYPPLLDTKQDEDHPIVRARHEGRSIVSPSPESGHELMIVALQTFEQEFVGTLVLELPRALKAPRKGRRDPLRAFVEALSSTAAVAIATRHLVDSQQKLLDGLIQLLAGAIDAKSPYTGGHCQRVPEIARLIAEAAEAAGEGRFKDFHLKEDERETLRIAAWLHDCGKVTTPEYVVDKATKLETLYNRIHEIRMRFEVIKRDEEIEFLKRGGQDNEALKARWRELDEDFAFVAACNLGGEFMAQDKIERLSRIAQRRWQRTLDDRLGLSREELRRLKDLPASPLPVTENLLADRPEHLVPRPAEELLPADNPWGICMDVPEHKFNLGELHNLSIGRGTLTEEERYLINEHIVQTIIMLSRLPFPRHLQQVPEIAGGHHERMDGRGYPRRLLGVQMSVPARMMAIADVFEALTAADRPYKPPKPLSESLALMASMVSEGHLDADIFELFIRARVYRHYAERFLPPEQIDEIEDEALIRRARERRGDSGST